MPRNKSEYSQYRLELALEASRMGTWELDLQTGQLTGSPRHAAILGISETASDVAVLSGQLVHPDDQAAIRRAWTESAQNHTPLVHQYRIVRPDGEVRWVEVRGETKLDSEGNPHILLGVLLDVTDRVTGQLQLKESNDKLQLAVCELEQERDLRERFVAALSHDLRTPIAAAKLAGDLLLRKAQDPIAVQKMAERIVSNMKRAERMIRDLLDVSRLKAGQGIPVSFSIAKLDQIVSTAVEDLNLVHGRRFVVQNESGEICGNWDPEGVRRMIENLAGNAIKYGDSNSLVTIKLAESETSVQIEVHNKGLPIPLEEQKSLFHAYRRATSAVSGGHKGWGIGLMLVKGIAEAHGGSVSLESSAEKGTIFVVTLPKDSRRQA